jgi:dTDP-4-amino-4,6-dideoxygalactose transaminase
MKSENNPYNIVRMFEDEIANYTGAPYAVSCDSCTNAIFLCLEWLKEKKGKEPIPKYNPMDVDEDCWIPMRIPEVTIPRRTYLSVPQSIIHAGFKPVLEDIEWCGEYQLKPLPVWDSAKRFTSGMYRSGQMQCLSFHIKKHLKLGKGGMILTDDPEAVKWLKKARYEGRTESYSSNETDVEFLGWNMYMEPTIAAKGLTLMQAFPKDNPDLPENPPYKELDKYSIFKNLKVIK